MPDLNVKYTVQKQESWGWTLSSTIDLKMLQYIEQIALPSVHCATSYFVSKLCWWETWKTLCGVSRKINSHLFAKASPNTSAIANVQYITIISSCIYVIKRLTQKNMPRLALMCIHVLWYTSQLFGCVSLCLPVLSFSSPCRTSDTFIGQDEKCHKISSLYFIFLV